MPGNRSGGADLDSLREAAWIAATREVRHCVYGYYRVDPNMNGVR